MSPALGIIPLFVKKKYGLANAAAVSGAATGTFIFTPLNQLLLETYGWRGTLIVFSAINANMFISGALFRTHVTINTSRNKEDNVKNCDSKNTIDETSGSQSSCCFPLTRVVTAFGLKVFCNVPTFGLLCICKFFGVGLGFVSTPAYVVLYTANIKLASPERLALLVSIFAAGSIIGRLSPPAILYVSCSCLNSTRLFGISLLLAGISTLLSPFLATSYGSYSVYTALLGIFSGIFLTLMSHVIKDSTGGLNVTAGFGPTLGGKICSRILGHCALIGSTLGGKICSCILRLLALKCPTLRGEICSRILGPLALKGPTLGGFIYDKTGDYKNSFYFYGSCMTFAGLLMLILEPCSRNAIKKSSITTNVLTTVSSTRNLIDIATQTGREDGAM
uniref:Monocarboxylate transporter 12-like n=1 Tax=Saccoglossus kowalevskii TaxID=10224 RepID=A0ABM0MKQ2_SACKO|nr:PREDICTED: monocarboxylate transporter 12-like [Saccoglossus kowalevskii]